MLRNIQYNIILNTCLVLIETWPTPRDRCFSGSVCVCLPWRSELQSCVGSHWRPPGSSIREGRLCKAADQRVVLHTKPHLWKEWTWWRNRGNKSRKSMSDIGANPWILLVQPVRGQTQRFSGFQGIDFPPTVYVSFQLSFSTVHTEGAGFLCWG